MSQENAQSLVEFFNTSVKENTQFSFMQTFSNSLFENFKFFLSYYILAMSVYTAWACAGLGAAKGFSIGFTVSFLISNYSSNGISYVILAMIPSMMLCAPLYFFASVVCINFAIGRRKRKEVGMRTAIGIIPALGVIYCATAVSGLYDALISLILFKNLF